jgi:cardiolipin synthase
MLSRPMSLHPIMVSKANTFSQIVLAGLVLAELGLGLGLEELVEVCVWITGALTILSAGGYFWAWLTHMASYEPARAPLPSRKTKPAPIKTVDRSGVRAT